MLVHLTLTLTPSPRETEEGGQPIHFRRWTTLPTAGVELDQLLKHPDVKQTLTSGGVVTAMIQRARDVMPNAR